MVIAGGVAMQLAGCMHAYKAAVEKYAQTLPARANVAYASIMPELKKELVLNDASLACLVDKDHGEPKAPSCTCADGKPDDWQANCTAWIAGN
jgi:hypothetical protein